MKIKSRLSTESAVPMAAMADIAFLLIVFFMLTSTFAKDTGLDISLPTAQTSQDLPKRDITVHITRSGEVHINRTVIPADPRQIIAALREAFSDESVRSVTIRGDQGVPYGAVVRVMDIAKQSGAAITLAAVFEEE